MRPIDGFLYDSLPPKIKNFIRARESDWQNWSDEQVIAFVYTQLGENYSLDPIARYGNEIQKIQIEEASNNSRSFFSRLSKKTVTCIDLTNMVNFVLNDIFGIRCISVVDGSGPHRYNIAQPPTKSIKLDLQEDLTNIQSKRKLEHFGTEEYYDGRSFSTYTEEEQNSLLSSIGYPGITYTNDCLDSYAVVLNDNNVPLHERLELILLAAGVKYEKPLSRMGYCERVELLKKCITDYIPLSTGQKRKSYKIDDEISHETVLHNGRYISIFSVKAEDGYKHYMNDGSSLKYDIVDEQEYRGLFSYQPTARQLGEKEM